jgi:signal transduction histidine kinase
MLFQGQVFFVLGLSILFLTRGGVRLEVARELAPLAAFGFCEAIGAWCGAWLQVSPPSGAWLPWMRLLAIASGYAFLLASSLQIVIPSGTRAWARWLLAGGLLLLWGIGVVLVHPAGTPGDRVRLLAEIAARYSFAVPGGLLGAFQLRHEIYRTIEPDRFLLLLKPPMRIAGVALFAFALSGGAIGPAASFFPANVVNEEVLLAQSGIPISLLRGLAGLGMAVGVVRAIGVAQNEIEIWLESAEQMQTLAAERERIGRELHDGIIQSIYATGLILEGARQKVTEHPEVAGKQMTVAIGNLNDTIKDIRRYIFDLRGEMSQEDLETGLRGILREFRTNTLLETSFVVDGGGPRRLDAERRRHVFQIAREALTNVARHAHARKVVVRLDYGLDSLCLSIADNGIGLSAIPSGDGHGLRNMRQRTRLLNGSLEIDTAPGQGLAMVLTVPYQQRVGSDLQTSVK